MPQYSIDDAKKLFNDRAGTRGISSNVSPDKFNRWWQSAELKFFNERFSEYARTQIISDSISKWLSNPIYMPIPANGFMPFWSTMSLLHVDSMTAFLPSTITTGAIGSITLTPGSGYTDGTYTINLTGGTGTLANATVTVLGGVVILVLFNSLGIGYTAADVLTGTIPAGTGWHITVTGVAGTTDYKVKRVEKNRWSANISSTYDQPTQEFSIYTQFATQFQFAPANLGVAKIVYLQQPVWSFWGYTLNGYIATLTGLVGGSLYTNGTYTNVPLTGGAGNSALATVVVSGNAVTSITLTNPGKIYLVGDVLSASNANLGGTGSGFSITVSSLVAGSIRPIYNLATSVQPLWNNDDISTIVDLALQDGAIAARDKELANFADKTAQSLQ